MLLRMFVKETSFGLLLLPFFLFLIVVMQKDLLRLGYKEPDAKTVLRSGKNGRGAGFFGVNQRCAVVVFD